MVTGLRDDDDDDGRTSVLYSAASAEGTATTTYTSTSKASKLGPLVSSASNGIWMMNAMYPNS